MARFINPFTDIGFKRIFGQEFSKPLLLDFLNNLLAGEQVIKELTFLDKEQPAIYADDRSLIYDIYCTTDNNENIIVEMQNKDQSFFKKRSIYYVSEAIARQGEKGSLWKYQIKAVYLIAFLNFKNNEIGNTFRTDVALMNTATKELFSHDIRMTYLQLPFFNKEVEECNTGFERWIYVLKHMDILDRLPFEAQSSVFRKLSQIADISALSKEERLKYDEGIKKYRDTLCVMDFAINNGRKEGIEQGRKQGIEEGRKEGRKEVRLENARKVKQKGYPIEDIADITGLTMAEIEAL